MNRDRLYGLPFSEAMSFDLESVYEQADYWTGADDERPERVVIEEWTVAEPSDHLPAAAHVLEHLLENWISEEVTEAVWDHWSDAAAHTDVVAAMQTALDLLASKVDGRMASKRVATHIVTFDGEGEPILNGERLYRPVECPGQESLL